MTEIQGEFSEMPMVMRHIVVILVLPGTVLVSAPALIIRRSRELIKPGILGWPRGFIPRATGCSWTAVVSSLGSGASGSLLGAAMRPFDDPFSLR
jgi:hypothetical protein